MTIRETNKKQNCDTVPESEELLLVMAKWAQHEIKLPALNRGCHLITQQVCRFQAVLPYMLGLSTCSPCGNLQACCPGPKGDLHFCLWVWSWHGKHFL